MTSDAATGQPVWIRPRGQRWRLEVWRVAKGSPLGAVALAFVVMLALIALLAPVIAPFDPLIFHRVDRLQGPNGTYLLGTDQSGRDQFSRLIYGTRVSLYVGVAPIALSLIFGTAIGAVSGLAGGFIDAIIQRLSDALMAIPALVVALTVVTLLGPTLNNVVLAIAMVTIPAVNRVARAAALQIVALPYMTAAQSLGASPMRILLRHLIPNILSPVVVFGASLVGAAILAEAGLSFLGLGIPPPDPTWGNMLSGDNKTIFEVAPWLVIAPGIAITLTVLAFNLLGDLVRDLMDPRTRNGD